MAQIPTADENLNIASRIQEIKERSVLHKKTMSDFLESYVIVSTNNFSINDYLTYYIWQMESPFLSSLSYTYWVAGGLSWNNWFNNDDEFLIEEKISMTTGNFEIHYIYNDDTIFDKIKALYFLTIKLKEILTSKGINTKIILTNFDVIIEEGKSPIFNFIKNYDVLFKELFYNIKLVLDLNSKGGATKPIISNKSNSKRQFKIKPQPILFLREMAKIMSLKRTFTEEEKKILLSNIDVYNEKTIVEFHLDLFEKDEKNSEIPFDINAFNNAYILKPKTYIVFNPQIDNIMTMRLKLNILNELGLITFSYLSTSNRFSEMGLNIDLYRQNIFIKKQLGNNRELIIPYFQKVLNVYTQLFKNKKSYNIFFIEKIQDIINSYSSFYFTEFIDFIDKWFISKFRPPINSFIKEINADLEKFNVKLFIAGGDAMRRYDTNISFTKDIDTKLYIGNASSPQGTNLTPIEIKQAIIDIIITHIVKLRNYLQQNFQSLFTENCITMDKKIVYKSDNKVFQLYLSNDDNKYHQFRTREIKKNELFPVDLYSIDFNIKIVEYDLLTKKESIKLHTISLLDVVLQDNDNLYPDYFKVFDDIPVASLKFLLEDFIKTYTTPDKALARIASGKVHKDIKRYEQIFDLYNREKNDNLPPANPPLVLTDDEIDTIISNIISILPEKTPHITNILSKFKNRSEFDICDLIIIIEMLKNQTIISHLHPQILTLLKDLAYFNKNFYFEQLNKSDPNYHTYDYKNTKDYIANIYLDLFKAICNLNDGQQKHSISYNIYKIRKNYYELVKKQNPPKKTTITKNVDEQLTSRPITRSLVAKTLKTKTDKSKAKSKTLIIKTDKSKPKTLKTKTDKSKPKTDNKKQNKLLSIIDEDDDI